MNFLRSLPSPRSRGALAASVILAGSLAASNTSPPDTTLRERAKKHTEPQATVPVLAPTPLPGAKPLTQSSAASLPPPRTTTAMKALSRDNAADKDTARKPSPALASLPSTKAASAPLRILLVDDDWSENNSASAMNARLSGSDIIFRKLVANAVAGDATAWSLEVVPAGKHGPSIDRMRDYNIVLWYTGASYGGSADNVAVLSLEDEKTVRRYLQEVGGSFILVSPGYVSNLGYGTTWKNSAHPFLKEVGGVNGFAGLVQRFSAGSVHSAEGSSFEVHQRGAAESQFSAVNPDGAAVIFTSSLNPSKTANEPVPVAVANPFSGGRFIYVGFTLENIADADRSRAFDLLLTAAVGTPLRPPAIAVATEPIRPAPICDLPAQPSNLQPPIVTVSGTPKKTLVSWSVPGSAATFSPNQQVVPRASASPRAAGPTVVVERLTPDDFGRGRFWQQMIVADGASQVVDNEVYPGEVQKYRVTATAADGSSTSTEVEYRPPMPQDPESLSATLLGDNSVVLTWPEVPGVTKYRVQNHLSTGIDPTVVSGATRWQTPPLDGSKRTWTVTSLYENSNGEYISLTPPASWPRAVTQGVDQYFLVAGTFTIHTGNDNKELQSRFRIDLYINGGETEPDDPVNPNPLRLQRVGHSFGSNTTELKVNSSATFDLDTAVDPVWLPRKNNLANIQQHGLRIVITYEPNFPLDAWKIDGVTVTLNFQDRDQIRGYKQTGRRSYSPGMENKTITFLNVSKLLTASNARLDLIADRFLMPVSQP
jgi:hypothetical protein